MIIIYFFIGFLVSVLASVPLGAVNLAVINTTKRKSPNQALKIAYTAGIAEVLLAISSVYFGMTLQQIFQDHLWIQQLIIILFLTTGLYFIFKRKGNNSHQIKSSNFLGNSEYFIGFILALINPPVILFWILAISILNQNDIFITSDSSYSNLLIFSTGIYLGKVGVLYGYTQFTKKTHQKNQAKGKNSSVKLGLILIIIALIQGMRLYLN